MCLHHHTVVAREEAWKASMTYKRDRVHSGLRSSRPLIAAAHLARDRHAVGLRAEMR
jgi:putative NIF3 family GTP cyclohydrolase 1 type 2